MKYFLTLKKKKKTPYNPEDSWPPEITTLCLSLLKNLPRNSCFQSNSMTMKERQRKAMELRTLAPAIHHWFPNKHVFMPPAFRTWVNLEHILYTSFHLDAGSQATLQRLQPGCGERQLPAASCLPPGDRGTQAPAESRSWRGRGGEAALCL